MFHNVIVEIIDILSYQVVGHMSGEEKLMGRAESKGAVCSAKYVEIFADEKAALLLGVLEKP